MPACAGLKPLSSVVPARAGLMSLVWTLFSFTGAALIFLPFYLPPIQGLNLALASAFFLRQRFRADLDSALIC
ncbi:hypothetical protein SODG_004261 [Sodalis praecaptivus]